MTVASSPKVIQCGACYKRYKLSKAPAPSQPLACPACGTAMTWRAHREATKPGAQPERLVVAPPAVVSAPTSPQPINREANDCLHNVSRRTGWFARLDPLTRRMVVAAGTMVVLLLVAVAFLATGGAKQPVAGEPGALSDLSVERAGVLSESNSTSDLPSQPASDSGFWAQPDVRAERAIFNRVEKLLATPFPKEIVALKERRQKLKPALDRAHQSAMDYEHRRLTEVGSGMPSRRTFGLLPIRESIESRNRGIGTAMASHEAQLMYQGLAQEDAKLAAELEVRLREYYQTIWDQLSASEQRMAEQSKIWLSRVIRGEIKASSLP